MCEDHYLCGIHHHHHLSDHQSGFGRLNDIQMLNIGLVGCPTPHKKMGAKNERDVQVGSVFFFLRRIIIPSRELSPHKWKLDYIVLIQVILYSLARPITPWVIGVWGCLKAWKSLERGREREKGPSSQVDISQRTMLQFIQFYSSNWTWISDQLIKTYVYVLIKTKLCALLS